MASSVTRRRVWLLLGRSASRRVPSNRFVGSTRYFCASSDQRIVVDDANKEALPDVQEGASQKTHSFQAETRQLLDIVTNSLYTDKEVFLRELISNSADALEKARHLQISGTELRHPDTPLEIRITVDEEARTIVIEDTGVGMTEEEMHKNIGTIARSGSKAFVQKEKEKGAQADVLSNMIGQFGVGFYAAFMVAGDVDVYSRTAAVADDADAHVWRSNGSGEYSVTPLAKNSMERGTKIVLHLKEDCKEFANKDRVRSIIKKYSNFINFPIVLDGDKINTVQALWAKSKNDVTEEEHEEFYKFISNAFDKPKYTFHFSADAPISISALCYIGNQHMEKFGGGRLEPNMSLYSRKVLIEGKSKHIFPDWLRFVSGVVDSEDIPLSISREGMQDSGLIKRIQTVLTKRIIRFLADQAKKDAKGYEDFFAEHGQFIKEGVVSDFENKNDIAKLLLFESSRLPKGELTSLDEYISRCTPDQKKVYYLTAPDRALAEASAYFEVFQDSDTEVLFMYSPIDDFVMTNLNEYNGRQLVTAETASVDDLDAKKKTSSEDGDETSDDKSDDGKDEEDVGVSLSESEAKELAEWMKSSLGEDKVAEVRTTNRLRSSPAIVVDHESGSLRRMMKMVEHQSSRSGESPMNFLPKQTMEINPDHPVIVNLQKSRLVDPDRATLVAEQLFDNSLITAGLMDDSRLMLPRLNKLMAMALETKSD